MQRASFPYWSRIVIATSLALGLVSACVGAPDDVASLSGESPLDQRSDHGLVNATVQLGASDLERGPNDFLVTLRAVAGEASPILTSVEATMAAHGHHAVATGIVDEGARFRIEDLDLFMSGRWQIVMVVELDARSDLVEFALDVP